MRIDPRSVAHGRIAHRRGFDRNTTSVVAMLALTLGLLAHARADQIPGKGGNCAATWDTGTAVARAGANSHKTYIVLCEDGDLSCDTDGVPNGTCSITINACVGQITPTCPSPPALKGPLGSTLASRRDSFSPDSFRRGPRRRAARPGRSISPSSASPPTRTGPSSASSRRGRSRCA
jgi:hypothetical protein